MFADWAPAIDVQETDGEYLIKADLPAVKREDVKVSVEDGILAVEGERQQEKEEKGKKFHRIERSYGKFVRRVSVPSDVDQAHVAAEFKDGVLRFAEVGGGEATYDRRASELKRTIGLRRACAPSGGSRGAVFVEHPEDSSCERQGRTPT
jgi:hypothetical protein